MIKVYADTSVFGGVFDEEFSEPSKKFFEEVQSGRFLLVTSAIVQAEIEAAPQKVCDFFHQYAGLVDIAEISQKVLELRQAYLDANIVTINSLDDAAHVAVASVSKCQMIVSWNFRHIVHFEKIPKYNAVNTIMGYDHIDIYSPLEVIQYDES